MSETLYRLQKSGLRDYCRYFEQKRRDQLQREATARGEMKDSQRERPKETKSAYAQPWAWRRHSWR